MIHPPLDQGGPAAPHQLHQAAHPGQGRAAGPHPQRHDLDIQVAEARSHRAGTSQGHHQRHAPPAIVRRQQTVERVLGATGAVLFVPRRDGSFYSTGAYEKTQQVTADSARDLEQVIIEGQSHRVAEIAETSWALGSVLGGQSAMLLPVHDSDRVVAVLAVGWKAADMLPNGSAVHVAEALAQLTASAIARTALTRDVAFERRLRASVMDELPIAVSVFAGDPPEVVDWNRKERQLLGIDDDSMRPHDLAESQHEFDVRFADGTPLTVDTAPVTTAIQSGKATGPFILLIRRADGSQVHTRTYCAPFFDSDGVVAGAVVTSEPLDLDSSS